MHIRRENKQDLMSREINTNLSPLYILVLLEELTVIFECHVFADDSSLLIGFCGKFREK